MNLALAFFFHYLQAMHEMSLAASLINIITDELDKAGKNKLLKVTLRYGSLSNVLPEALSTAFELLIAGTALANAEIALLEEPAELACSACGEKFRPKDRRDLFAPCPACGRELGHRVVSGKGLYIESLEVE